MSKKQETEDKKTKEKKAGKRAGSKKKILIIVLIAAVAAVIAIVCGINYVKGHVKNKLDAIDRIDVTEAEDNYSENTLPPEDNYTTIALFGIDNRSNGSFETGNSDAILVVSINNDSKEVRVASVYRDTYLNTGKDTFRKANYAYAAGGPTRAITMLQKNLDMEIDGYVTVDFNALVEIIDLLGGVEIDVSSQEAHYMVGYIDEVEELSGKSSSYVSAGYQTLDGVQATAYSRVRYTAGGDYERTARQREVIEKLVEGIKASSYTTLIQMLDVVIDDISTSFSSEELLAYAKDASNYTITQMDGFPFDKCADTVGKLGSIVIPVDLDTNVEQLHAFLYPDVTNYVLSKTVTDYSDIIINNVGQYEPELD